MFIDIGRWQSRASMGCDAPVTISMMPANDRHCAPLGRASRAICFYKHATPSGVDSVRNNNASMRITVSPCVTTTSPCEQSISQCGEKSTAGLVKSLRACEIRLQHRKGWLSEVLR